MFFILLQKRLKSVMSTFQINSNHKHVLIMLILIFSFFYCASQDRERIILDPFKTPTGVEFRNLALEHFENGELTDAFSMFKKAANLNDPDGTFFLAAFYDGSYGDWGQIDLNKSVQLFLRSAELNSALGCYKSASLYMDGLCVDKNFSKAAELYQKTISLVDNDFNLRSNNYHRPIVTDINNLKIAIRDTSAIILSDLYFYGLGVEKDLNKSISYLSQPAESGNVLAQLGLGRIYFNRELYQKAAFWLDKAANAEIPEALRILGFMYQRGLGVDKDPEKALVYYSKAQEYNDYQAMNNLGTLYNDSIGVNRDYKIAYYWYLKAIETAESQGENCAMAERNIGSLFENGYFVEKNDSIALSWYQKAYNHGDAGAKQNLINLSSKLNRTYSIIDGFPVNERCTAIIIGNSDYRHSPLKNPAQDAAAMYNKLLAIGIENPILSINDDSKTLIDKLHKFYNQAKGYDAAILFYSGHGAQKDGINYILPIDVTINSSAFNEFISINEILNQMNLVGIKKKILFLDACRTYEQNKDSKAFVGVGLSNMKDRTGIPDGSYILFATKTNSTADDGLYDKNSPFTTVLLEELSKPNIDIRTIAGNVRNEVFNRTRGQQQPSFEDQLMNNFYFNVNQ